MTRASLRSRSLRSPSCACACASGRDEGGLTLIELLVSITISTLVVSVLASAAILFFQHSTDNDHAYSDQASIQVLQSVFTADAQSATSVVQNDASACGSATTALASFVWSDAGTTVKASWFVEQAAGSLELVRRRCTNGTATEKTDVAGVQPTPAVACAPACAAPTTVTITGVTTNGAGFTVTGTRRTS